MKILSGYRNYKRFIMIHYYKFTVSALKGFVFAKLCQYNQDVRRNLTENVYSGQSLVLIVS